MFTQWFLTSWYAVLMVFLSTLCIYAGVIISIRIVGLRALSKMSSFDFVMTVAVGSLIASTILTKNPPLLLALAALASIFFLQFCIAKLRKATRFERWIDNQPILLMVGRTILHDNLKKARVTQDDLYAKLREANALDPGQVRAVVLESTGDISVLHGPADGPPLDPAILQGVKDVERWVQAGAVADGS